MTEFREWVLGGDVPQWVADLAANEGGDRFINGWREKLTREGVRAVDFEFDGETPVKVGLDFSVWQMIDHGIDSALQDALSENRRLSKRRQVEEERTQAASDAIQRRFPS